MHIQCNCLYCSLFPLTQHVVEWQLFCYETRTENYFQFAFTNEHSSCTHNSIAACNCHSSVMVHVHVFVVQLVMPKVHMIAHIVIADDSQSQTSKMKNCSLANRTSQHSWIQKDYIYPDASSGFSTVRAIISRAHLEFYNYTIYCDVHTHIYHTHIHTNAHTHAHTHACM